MEKARQILTYLKTDLGSRSKPVLVSLLVLVLLAAVLRLYNIRDTMIFLGDEGRDALAVKRTVIDLDPVFLGPTASVGGFYLGPVYYYMIAPFMLLTGMDPVGAAVFVALLGVATIVMLYLWLESRFGWFAALIVSLLYTVAPNLVSFARSSWNPNPIPFFVVLSLVLLDYYYRNRNRYLLIGLGICLGIIIQLHYLGLIVCGTIGLLILFGHKPKHWFKPIAALALGFGLGAAPYLLFEIRHGFLNVQAVLEFITRDGQTTGPRSWNLVWLFFEVNRFVFEAIMGSWFKTLSQQVTLLWFIFLGVSLPRLWFDWDTYRKHKPTIALILGYWLISGLGLGFYRGQLHYHYFLLYFPAPFLVTALGLTTIKTNWLKLVIGALSILAVIGLWQHLPSFKSGSKLLDQTQRVSNQVIEMSQGQGYNFALITEGNSDHAYRYFLELAEADPTPLEERVESQLIVVCEKWPESTCAPLGNPLWEIAGFGQAEIIDQVEVYPQITIYRLEHIESSRDKIGKPAK